ncbi:MAG: transposase, partial [Pseudomonadota bacterium]
MIRHDTPEQPNLSEFEANFQPAMDDTNRWVRLSGCIPWARLSQAYEANLSATQGRPAKSARLVIGAMIIKHKLCLSDRETISQIQENPYLQYFVGLPGYQAKPPFAPSLFVEIRKRMGQTVFDAF